MAFHLIGTEPFTSTYVLDDEADVADLPTDCGIGSQAICAESADGSGIGRVTYILNGNLEWVK